MAEITEDSREQLETLINECKRAGADVNEEKARNAFETLTEDNDADIEEALRTVESIITERCGLPESIKYGPVSPIKNGYKPDVQNESPTEGAASASTDNTTSKPA